MVNLSLRNQLTSLTLHVLVRCLMVLIFLRYPLYLLPLIHLNHVKDFADGIHKLPTRCKGNDVFHEDQAIDGRLSA